MARMMLTVGDFQASISPVPGSVSDLARAMTMPEGHPLAAGDHEVTFYEPYGCADKFWSAVMGENDAIVLVAAWMQVDEGESERAFFEHLLRKYNPEGKVDLSWLLP